MAKIYSSSLNPIQPVVCCCDFYDNNNHHYSWLEFIIKGEIHKPTPIMKIEHNTKYAGIFPLPHLVHDEPLCVQLVFHTN